MEKLLCDVTVGKVFPVFFNKSVIIPVSLLDIFFLFSVFLHMPLLIKHMVCMLMDNIYKYFTIYCSFY